jgi:murein DD-endopeptidase MepM/ murein hydrolase activator NlpD
MRALGRSLYLAALLGCGTAATDHDAGRESDAAASDAARASDAGPPSDAGARVIRGAPPLDALAEFIPPVPRPEQISSTFGPRWKTSASRYDFHPGIDWFDAEGTPVTAIGDGTVDAVHPDGSTAFPDGGNVLVVRHALTAPITFHAQSVDHIFAVYLHLQSFAVAEGDPVTRGQVVAAMGQTGDTDFVHLHFEIRVQTVCSLQYQTANPAASCVTGFDPHVHPFLFVGGRDENVVTLEEIAPAAGEAFAVRYTATRGDLDLDVIETDLGALGFDERRGMDATSLAVLDDFHYPWLTLVPAPFTSTDEQLVMELHFPVRPAFVEIRDIHGAGLRLGP